MAVSARYIEWRVRSVALQQVAAYVDFMLREIIPVFANMEQRAEAAAASEYERLSSELAGEFWDGDIDTLAEQAHDKGLAIYETLNGLRQSVLNLFAVGLFHLLEQEIADLCRDASFDVEPPNDTKLDPVADWYKEHFDLDLRSLPSWAKVDELRLVANVTKHAEGNSARRLRELRPALFQLPSLREMGFAPGSWPISRPLAGDDLYVTAENLQEYGQAAVDLISEIANHFKERGEESYPR